MTSLSLPSAGSANGTSTVVARAAKDHRCVSEFCFFFLLSCCLCGWLSILWYPSLCRFVCLSVCLFVNANAFVLSMVLCSLLLQAKASVDAFRAAAEAKANQAAQQRSALIEERDRSLEQVIVAWDRNCSTPPSPAATSYGVRFVLRDAHNRV